MAWLAEYPLHHEVLGTLWSTDTRLYDGHNTQVYFAWFARDTGRQVAVYAATIPDPSEYGYNYWSAYRVWSWVTHSPDELRCGEIYDVEISWTSNTLPDTKVVKQMATSAPWPCEDEIICTPGARVCQGTNLMECNALGTGWDLIAANSPICQGQGGCPDFWSDPIGAVTCWILSAFEAALGLVTGGFLLLQSNVNNFMDNFSTQIVAFLGDIKTAVEDAIGGAIATLSYVTSTVTTYVSDWWAETILTLSTWMSDAWTDLTDFWNDITTHIGDWWDDTKKSIWDSLRSTVAGITDFIDTTKTTLSSWWTDTWTNLETWIHSQWNSFTDFIDDVKSEIGTWWDNTMDAAWNALNDSLAAIEDWATSTFLDFVDWINTLGQDVADFVEDRIDDAKTLLDDSIQTIKDGIPDEVNGLFDALLTSNPVVKFLYDMITGTYMDTEENKRRQQDIIERRNIIKEIIENIR